MAKKKGKHESDKNQKQSYKNEGRHSTNTLLRLYRTLKKQPANAALAARIKELETNGVPYTRNRRSILAGSKRTPWKTVKDYVKLKKELLNTPRIPDPNIAVLKGLFSDLWNAKKPKIRVKNAKRNRVPKAS